MRLFIALRPPQHIRDRLFDLMDEVPDARWQDDEQLHLTIRFVGEVDRPVAEDLAEALQTLRAPMLTIRLAGVGAFGARGRAGALWAGIDPREPTAALHRKVDQLCVRVGLEPEHRAFKPHITVARLSRSGGGAVDAWCARHASFSTPEFALDELTLFQSHLGRAGASYEPLLSVPLSPAL